MARTVRILIADIRANASNRVGVDIITGRTKVPSSVGEDGAGDGAGDESRTVADGILVDEHAPSGETGGGAAGNASHVDLDRTGVTNTGDLVAGSIFGVEQGLDSVFRARRNWLSRGTKPGVAGSKQLRDHILTRDAQPGVRGIE